MAKRAFCVGINDYPTEGSDLRGCVNDANAWADLLTTHFDFAVPDVRIVTDTDASKANMLAGLQDLLAGATRGDVLVFTNSSHGSYVVDADGDEERYDQVVCPWDLTANMIVDDELRELFSAIPAGVSLVAIMDNCHSGNGTRRVRGAPEPPETRRVRFHDPASRGERILKDPLRARPKQRARYPEAEMREVLLSGCTELESSFDDKIGGVFHGAMTYYAIKAIRDAGYTLSWSELHDRLSHSLTDTPYQQHPQLEGQSANKARPIFT
jgi:hypothetical protein